MPDYDNNLTGLLSRNDRKTEDRHADFRGQCEIDGVEYWIDGYKRQRKDGSGSFLSLRFKPKTAPVVTPAPPKGADPWDDDIGF